MRSLGFRIAIVMLIPCALSALASGPQAAPAPDGLNKLGAFVGTWKSEGEMKDSAYSKAQPNITSEFTCQWSPNHGFMVCDQEVRSPNGINNDLSIYTFDESKHEYRFFGFGRNDARVRTPALTIEGNTWVYLGGFEDGSKHVRFRTTNVFTSQGHVRWRSEYSEDGSQWTLMGEGTDIRVGSAQPSSP